MRQKFLVTILPSLFISVFLASNAFAHGGSGKHYIKDGSGNAVKSSSGCITSSGEGGGAEGCGDAMMAKAEEPAPAPAPEPAPAPAPEPMKEAAKPMGAAHSHPANHCTNSVLHTHAAPGGHTHHYSCKSNRMASPRQMAKPHQKSY